MKLVLLVYTGMGVTVYDAGSDVHKAAELLKSAEVEYAPNPCTIAILHPRPRI
jgi:hypothetical protein